FIFCGSESGDNPNQLLDIFCSDDDFGVLYKLKLADVHMSLSKFLRFAHSAMLQDKLAETNSFPNRHYNMAAFSRVLLFLNSIGFGCNNKLPHYSFRPFGVDDSNSALIALRFEKIKTI
ncbi:MAG: hypothetical protein WCL39_08600, partial [Armatimonadota bacterium]